MFADDIAFVCFYDAERVVSVIAHLHLLGEGEGRYTATTTLIRPYDDHGRDHGSCQHTANIALSRRATPRRHQPRHACVDDR